MMKERDYHKNYAIKYGSHNHWILYQSARNKVNSMMRIATSEYFRLKIDASKATDPKAGWKSINSLTGRGNKSSTVNDILFNDKIVPDDKDISESFNDFFVNNFGHWIGKMHVCARSRKAMTVVVWEIIDPSQSCQ